MAKPTPGTKDSYVAFREIQTRWLDNDAYGHMNNAVYYALFDTAISFWQIDNAMPLSGPDALRVVVAHSDCNYHSELAYPDPVIAGLRIGHLGRSSVRFEIGLFRGTSNTAAAEGSFTQVHIGDDGRSAPFPEPARTALQSILVPTA